jgi:hypothetical protein
LARNAAVSEEVTKEEDSGYEYSGLQALAVERLKM